MRSIPSPILYIIAALISSAGLAADRIAQSPRDIPVAYETDIVVLGGSTAAVSAACEASSQGARVVLLAPRPYLGDDLCATLRLWLEDGEQPTSKLAIDCFGTKRVATPFDIKSAMDRALVARGIPYLTGCYFTDVLRDDKGQLTGIVMVNRTGRQAVRAKVIIDATDFASAARQAGATFRPFTPGPQPFTRIVIGGPIQRDPALAVDQKPFTYSYTAKQAERRLPVYEYSLSVDLPDSTPASFAAAEHRARDLTTTRESELSSESLFHIPSETIIARAHLDVWPGAEKADLAAFRPRGISRLYVLSAYSDLSREANSKLLRPLEFMAIGSRVGRAAADEARTIPAPARAFVPEESAPAEADAAVEEELAPIRPNSLGTIHSGRRALPILGRYDVVVVGGGTAGAPAGIAAAKRGAKTLVVEYLHELGGVGTTGLIGSYWFGIRNGFTAYVDSHVNPGKSTWAVTEKAEWLRTELRTHGADVWLGALGCGALVRDRQVCGIIIATPQGRGIVLASAIIDATGNSNIAAAAHAPTQYGISELGAMNVQIAGFPERPLGKSIVNTAYTLVDDTDVLDVWHLMLYKRIGKSKSFDVGQLIDSRERRRIVGDYVLTVEDLLARRTFPDTISQHYSNFDAAAFPDSRLLLIADAKGPEFPADMPYRCLLPKGLDGLLVIGLGASAQRDAMTLLRMQADLQNQGYAAGAAAALAAKAAGHTRAIDLKALQRWLITEGVLEERVSTDKDSFPLDARQIEQAITALDTKDPKDRLAALGAVISHPQHSIPLLKARYAATPAGNEHLLYARILGILNDPTGAPALMAALDAQSSWDAGAALTSQRKTGNTFSPTDRLIIALGFSRAPTAQPALLRKLEQLRPDSELSHYKALSLALWESHPPEAAKPLADLLARPGFTGHATPEPYAKSNSTTELSPAKRLVTVNDDKPANDTNLNRAMKELTIAALLYRCGDRDGAGKAVLQQYAKEIHGHFARYARAVLEDRLK